MGVVRIPNYEVRSHWKKHVADMVLDTVLNEASGSQIRLQESLIAYPFSKSDLEKIMGELLYSSRSYMDTILENSYHCFYLGCFKTALDKMKDFRVKSNRESEKGRFDIVVVIESLRRVIIFELKEAVSLAMLKSSAEAALTQAFDKDYAAEFEGYQCYLIGIAFFKTTMSEFEIRALNVGN